MPTLCNVYKLIETAEQETKRGNLQNSIIYYKETLKEINEITDKIEESGLSKNVIEAVQLLRKDISQTIYDIQNVLPTENDFTIPYSNKIGENADVFRNESTNNCPSTADSNGINQNFLGSVYLRMNPSVMQPGGAKMWETSMNNDKLIPNNDPLFLGIVNKLQSNIIMSTSNQFKNGQHTVRGTQAIEEEIQQHVEQFRKEVSWYEQKRFEEYENRMKELEMENKKLNLQVDRLKQRWDSLVESAKERKKKYSVDST
ncbi:similar to Saccharomyces cerevisiae YLR211C ATG38 Putative protein of unknown function [Maudiozyma saulgeensis]|uniref:Uncharacterized protein n=1 Tax=Maudiozyma saulgeensis TaxID=1789683 RepID=A0A1X7R3T5_9SACH|nr:similar to Saccharomyces cerevisiae YLR211C ATG38 Putative protein of unknown function [Kazachstania saulgeensis]